MHPPGIRGRKRYDAKWAGRSLVPDYQEALREYQNGIIAVIELCAQIANGRRRDVELQPGNHDYYNN